MQKKNDLVQLEMIICIWERLKKLLAKEEMYILMI